LDVATDGFDDDDGFNVGLVDGAEDVLLVGVLV